MEDISNSWLMLPRPAKRSPSFLSPPGSPPSWLVKLSTRNILQREILLAQKAFVRYVVLPGVIYSQTNYTIEWYMVVVVLVVDFTSLLTYSGEPFQAINYWSRILQLLASSLQNKRAN